MSNTSHLSRSYSSQSGQIAVIVLLVMVVILTIGLSLAGRTVQDAQLSTESAESVRVFNAAESAVEEALAEFEANPSAFNTSQQVSLDSTFVSQFDAMNSAVSADIEASNELETSVDVGATATVDLTNTNGTVTVNWAEGETGCSSASVIIAVYQRNSGTITARYEAYEPNTSCGARNDAFQSSLAGVDNYSNRAQITVNGASGPGADGDVLMTVMPIYRSTKMRVAGLAEVQSHIITGNADNKIGLESRSIELTRGIDAAPSVMGYALFSGNKLSK